MARHRQNIKKVLKSLANNVRDLRREHGWTLEQCEEHGDLDWRQIQQIENGKNITLETLVRLANLFDVQAHQLLECPKSTAQK